MRIAIFILPFNDAVCIARKNSRNMLMDEALKAFQDFFMCSWRKHSPTISDRVLLRKSSKRRNMTRKVEGMERLLMTSLYIVSELYHLTQ